MCVIQLIPSFRCDFVTMVRSLLATSMYKPAYSKIYVVFSEALNKEC